MSSDNYFQFIDAGTYQIKRQNTPQFNSDERRKSKYYNDDKTILEKTEDNINKDECVSGDITNLNITNIQLSKKSRTLVILRILILFLVCIYIPVETIFSPKLDYFENDYIFTDFFNNFPQEVLNSSAFYYTSYIVITLFGDKDYIMIYSSILYMTYHPFISLKIVFVTHSVQYALVLLRCFYQSYRPYWSLPETNTENRFCSASYANPSLHYFFVTFFYLYALLSFHLINKKKNKLTLKKKLAVSLILLLFALFYGFFLLINKINYVYQLVFALTLSLIIICVLMDFEMNIHNSILSSLKNVFKIRKNKIRIFLIVLTLIVSAVIIYYFVKVDSLNHVQKNLIDNDFCFQNHFTFLGLKETFLEVTYVSGILGAFWGTALTVEYNCGKWWECSRKNLALKVFITICIGVAYVVIFSFITTSSFEFYFFLSIIKYTFFYYLIMGWVPILFDKCKLNKKIHLRSKKSLLFTQSIFSRGTIEEECSIKRTPTIFKKSMIVGDLEHKASNKHLEFLIS